MDRWREGIMDGERKGGRTLERKKETWCHADCSEKMYTCANRSE